MFVEGKIMDRNQIIQKLVAQKWLPRTIDVWVRAKCRCEYCGKSLVESPDEYFLGSHVDHIIPDAGDNLDNLALACKACNLIKRRRRFSEDDTVANATGQRSKVIEKASQYIAQIKERNQGRLDTQLKLLRALEKP